jgi:hypothetical protein
MSGNAPKQSPLLKVTPLWERSSAKGGQYLTGRLAGGKVLENRDRKTDDDPSHHLFFVEAPDRRQERGEGQKASKLPLTDQRPSTPHPGQYIIGTQEYGRALSQIGNMPFQAHLSLS